MFHVERSLPAAAMALVLAAAAFPASSAAHPGHEPDGLRQVREATSAFRDVEAAKALPRLGRDVRVAGDGIAARHARRSRHGDGVLRALGHRIAYTILPGAPVDPPEGSRIVPRRARDRPLARPCPRRSRHRRLRAWRTHVRDPGHVERVETLVKLAAWTGGGAVRS